MNKPSIYYVYVGYLLAIPAIHAVAVSQGLALEEAAFITGFAALVGNVIGAVITVFIRDSSHIMTNVSAATLAACAALAFTSRLPRPRFRLRRLYRVRSAKGARFF